MLHSELHFSVLQTCYCILDHHHRASVMMVAVRVLSNQNHITCRCCSCSCNGNASFWGWFSNSRKTPYPNHIGAVDTLDLPFNLGQNIIACTFHAWTMERELVSRKCMYQILQLFLVSDFAMCISMIRFRLNISLDASSLSPSPIFFSFWESTKMYLTDTN